MIVNPAPGALARDPVTLLAIVDGTDVDETDPYFARLITDGDLVPEAVAIEAKSRAAADDGTAARASRVTNVATTPSEDAA